MAKVINLKQIRKLAARDTKRAEATENAVKFGRTKTQKTTEDRATAKAVRHLDNHKLGEQDG